MKVISTIFTVLVIITGMSFKMMRLYRATQGDPVTSFELGAEMGAEMRSGHASPSPSEIQGNPFVK